MQGMVNIHYGNATFRAEHNALLKVQLNVLKERVDTLSEYELRDFKLPQVYRAKYWGRARASRALRKKARNLHKAVIQQLEINKFRGSASGVITWTLTVIHLNLIVSCGCNCVSIQHSLSKFARTQCRLEYRSVLQEKKA